MKDKTFAIIKPDAVKNGYTGKIYDRILKSDFSIIGAKLLQMTQDQAEGFYEVHKDRPFFGDLIGFMTSGPCMVLALEERCSAIMEKYYWINKSKRSSRKHYKKRFCYKCTRKYGSWFRQ